MMIRWFTTGKPLLSKTEWTQEQFRKRTRKITDLHETALCFIIERITEIKQRTEIASLDMQATSHHHLPDIQRGEPPLSEQKWL